MSQEVNPNFPAPGVTVPQPPDPGVVPAAENTVPPMDPKDAEIAELKSKLAEASTPTTPAAIQAAPVDPRDSIIQELQLKVNELMNRGVVSQVPPNTAPSGPSDPAIKFNQLEPGLKWAVANGLTSVDDVVTRYGEHMRALLSGLV